MNEQRGRRRSGALVAGAVVTTVAFAMSGVACGSRTGLLDLETEPVAGDDASVPPDASKDAGRDADAALPPIDAAPPVTVVKSDCPDASVTLVYVVTEETEVLAFDPANGSFRLLGHLDCPTPGFGWEPFSMAVDRAGRAYVLYNDIEDENAAGILYRVSLTTLSCAATAYVPGKTKGFTTFGMGFSTNLGGPTEQLYVAADDDPPRLGVIDTTTFVLSEVASLDPRATRSELTGTGDGRLFGFFQPVTASSASVGQIDKTTGELTAVNVLTGVDQGDGWAFGFYGGDFYLFTSPDGQGSDVTLFNPATNSVKKVAHYSGVIVGAGVSTCAPEQ